MPNFKVRYWITQVLEYETVITAEDDYEACHKFDDIGFNNLLEHSHIVSREGDEVELADVELIVYDDDCEHCGGHGYTLRPTDDFEDSERIYCECTIGGKDT